MHPETARNLRAYLIFRTVFLEKHPYCELDPYCLRPAMDLHHLKGHGYRGNLLCDERWIKAGCRECHKKVHDNAKESRKKGLLLF